MGDRGPGRCLLVAFVLAMACALPAAASGASFTWSKATTIDPAPFTQTHSVTAASCPTASLCVAGDDSGDILIGTAPNGGPAGWHAIRGVDPPLPFAAVSCPSRSLCVAVSQSGDVAFSKHPAAGVGAWHVVRTIAGQGVPLLGVACPTASLCVAIDHDGGVVAATHPTGGRRAWKRTAIIAPSKHDPLAGIACPSRAECVAIDSRNDEVVTSHRPGRSGTWTQTAIAAPRTEAYAPGAIDCGSPKLCVIAGTTGGQDNFVVTSTDPLGGRHAWKATRHLPKRTGYLSSISCPSASFCAATGYESPVIYTTAPQHGGASWHPSYALPSGDDNGPGGVTCRSSKLCVAWDTAGHVITSATPSSKPSWKVSLVDQVNQLDALDCASAGFCVAGGTGGRLETSTNPTGGPSAWAQSTLTLWPTTIACPSLTLCVTTGDPGDDGNNVAVSTTPATGAGSYKIAETGALGEIYRMGGIACPSVSLCVAPYYQVEDDSDGELTNVLYSTNPAGGTPAWALSDDYIDGGTNGGPGGGDGDVTDFACASTTLCVGGDDAGRVFASATPTKGKSWTKQRVDGRNAITATACAPASTLCVATDVAGNVITTTKPLTAQWHVTHIDPAGVLTAVDCPSTGLCVAVDGAHDAFVSTNPAGGASTWKRTTGIDGDLTALSCPTTQLCLAVDGDGRLTVGTR
jgi:hypothetical protein